MADPKREDRDAERGDTPGPEGGRDFGDSAGYGTGGSTLDRRDVGDAPPDEGKKPNPLDEVVKTGADQASR